MTTLKPDSSGLSDTLTLIQLRWYILTALIYIPTSHTHLIITHKSNDEKQCHPENNPFWESWIVYLPIFDVIKSIVDTTHVYLDNVFCTTAMSDWYFWDLDMMQKYNSLVYHELFIYFSMLYRSAMENRISLKSILIVLADSYLTIWQVSWNVLYNLLFHFTVIIQFQKSVPCVQPQAGKWKLKACTSAQKLYFNRHRHIESK